MEAAVGICSHSARGALMRTDPGGWGRRSGSAVELHFSTKVLEEAEGHSFHTKLEAQG